MSERQESARIGTMEFTPKQLVAIEALADGATGPVAAEAAGVGLRTVDRWKTDPAFVRAVSEAVALRFEAHRTDVRAMLGEAIAKVRADMAEDGGGSLAARILTAPHLAAFAGGAVPGATRVEHSGNMPIDTTPREVRITLVEPKRDADPVESDAKPQPQPTGDSNA